jgi:hypothetical protein
MTQWHLAQLNVARLRHPIDAPETSEFVANLDPINALAEASPGFVWRLQDDSGNATSIHPTPDPMFIVNLSVWASIAALEDFVRRSAHAALLRRRREWFFGTRLAGSNGSPGMLRQKAVAETRQAIAVQQIAANSSFRGSLPMQSPARQYGRAGAPHVAAIGYSWQRGRG